MSLFGRKSGFGALAGKGIASSITSSSLMSKISKANGSIAASLDKTPPPKKKT
jgi:hypothetical protein